MDRQVSKINKSDARDRWWRAHQDGVEACQGNPLSWRTINPYEKDPVAKKEWLRGWAEELDRLMEKVDKILR